MKFNVYGSPVSHRKFEGDDIDDIIDHVAVDEKCKITRVSDDLATIRFADTSDKARDNRGFPAFVVIVADNLSDRLAKLFADNAKQ